MSKYVKNLLTKDFSRRLDGVEDALLVNVVGMNANKTVGLRRRLREKGIQLLVVKNSLVQRATEGTSLAPAFESLEGSSAVVWGTEDFVSLTKEVADLDKSDEYKGFEAKGGVMDGEPLTSERVHEISKWPTREEQLSLLVGQILSPGADISGALLGPGRMLASQVKKKSEEEGGEE